MSQIHQCVVKLTTCSYGAHNQTFNHKSQASEYNPPEAQNKLYNVLTQHEILQYSTATLLGIDCVPVAPQSPCFLKEMSFLSFPLLFKLPFNNTTKEAFIQKYMNWSVKLWAMEVDGWIF